MKETDKMQYGYRYYGFQMKTIPTGYLEEVLPTIPKNVQNQPLIEYIQKRLKK